MNGSVTHALSCPSSYGVGGLGRHFAQLIEEAREAGELYRYYGRGYRQGDEDLAVVFPDGSKTVPFYRFRRRFLPAAFHARHVKFPVFEAFDRAVAERLVPATRFTAFAGKALRSFKAGRALGIEHLNIVAPNSHVDNVHRLHVLADEQTGIRDTWLSDAERDKTRREYEAADTVLVHSDYVRDSFLARGIPAEKLERTVLRVPARFAPPPTRDDDGVFRIAYVGRLEATKGVTVILDAFARLPIERAELRLMGGWTSRPVKQLVEAAVAADPRIHVAPGDPVPVLQRTDAYIHPTYEDGYAYSPVEALACGTPVVVTDETGMKEYVEDGVNGYIIPVGSADALVERLLALHARPLAATHRLLDDALVEPSDALHSASPPAP